MARQTPPATPVAGDRTCCICLEDMCGAAAILPCGHALHQKCASEMQRQGVAKRCPLCRAALPGFRSVDELLQEATLHWVQGNQQEAFQQVSEAYRIDPENPRVNFMLGKMHLQGRGVVARMGPALRHFKVARRAGHLGAARNMGILRIMQGKTMEGMQLVEAASKQGDVTSGALLGSENSLQAAVCSALEPFGAVVCALHRIAGDFEKNGYLKEAECFYGAAAQKGHPGAIYNLARLHEDTGGDSASAAVTFYQPLPLSKCPVDLRNTLRLGNLHLRHGHVLKAMQCFEAGSRAGCLRATLRLGELNLECGSFAEAAECFDVASRGGHLKATVALSNLHLQQGKLHASGAVLAAAVRSRLAPPPKA